MQKYMYTVNQSYMIYKTDRQTDVDHKVVTDDTSASCSLSMES